MYKRLLTTFLICFLIAIVVGTTASLILFRHYHIQPWNPTALVVLPLLILMTFLGLLFRFWRWHYFLRRSDIRLPTRLSMSIFLSAFSQTIIPLFIGEIALKAILVKRHTSATLERTILIVAYERLLDLMTLAILTIPYLLIHAVRQPLWAYLPICITILMILPPIRKTIWKSISSILKSIIHLLIPTESPAPNDYPISITSTAVTVNALILSLCSWIIVASILPITVTVLGEDIPWLHGTGIYAISAFAGGGSLSPGGVGVTGSLIAKTLIQTGISPTLAGLTGLITRLSTFGLVFAIGAVAFAAYLWKHRAATAKYSINTLYGYESEFATESREYYTKKKAVRIDNLLNERATQQPSAIRRILDIGCGPGWYLPLVGNRDSSVIGIDSSFSQLKLAQKNVPTATLLAGDICEFPIKDSQFDVAYAINIFHHLPTTQSQQQAFQEIHRILKPDGILMLHDMNVTNPLFRFYLGYILPLMNRIDQGIEIWIQPKNLRHHPLFHLRHTEYFTFLPDFLPGWMLRHLRDVESFMERSPIRKLSAHFMAVLQKR